MNEANENAIAPVGFDHHAPLLNKWLRKMLMVRFAGLLLTALAAFPFLTNVTGWLSRLLSVCSIVVLFQLAAANGRYRKAAIFSCITLAGSLISAISGANAFGMIVSICSIIAEYQEYHGHAEICADKDPALSGRWESLFWWQMGVGLVAGFLMSAGAVIGVLAGAESGILTTVILILNAVVSIAIGLVCLKTLKKTIALYS